MEQYVFSNSDIDEESSRVEKFLASVGVEHREALSIKLSFEEVLLDYKEKFSEEKKFSVRCVKRFSTIKVEISVEGESYNPFENENEITCSILAKMGLAPTWSYSRGKNCVVFIPKRKPLSGTVKLAIAFVLAIVVGTALGFSPEVIRNGASQYLLTPVSDALMGLISAVSGPLIFFSVLGSICSMGNIETFGKIGSKTIKYILIHITLIGAFITLLGSFTCKVEGSGNATNGFSQVIELVYDIIPSNLFQPFLSGNALQIIFVAIITGLAMLALSSRVSGVFSLVEQLDSVVQMIMTGIGTMFPIVIFFVFTTLISDGKYKVLSNSWKIILIISVFTAGCWICCVLRVAMTKKVSPLLLIKKAWPTFLICLTTASSAASLSTNLKDSTTKFGIDKKLAEFGIPLGQVLFMPGYVALLFGVEVGLAQAYDVAITIPWLVIGFFTNILLSFAVPPVPNGTVMVFAVAFAQLGIPAEGIGIGIAINTITDFLATACNVSSWQITLIEVADSLDMLDRDVLRSECKAK